MRWYRNDGKGHFSRVQTLPSTDGPVRAISIRDFNGDGFPDIFAGGWCKPGSWPVPTASHIFQNDRQGGFKDVTAAIAPDFAGVGIVYDLQWADVDQDAAEDLIVAAEWQPLRVFKYKNGRFEEITSTLHLSDHTGIWRSVVAADFDGDGDQDLIGGNLGGNTRYRATASEPLRVYAKDFDKNGSMDAIMTLMQYEKELTVAYRDVLVKHIPSVKKKFLRYNSYAAAVVTDIFPASELQTARTHTCTELRSMYFENQNGVFTARPLPNEAQIAPLMAQLVTDVNKDGFPDLIVAGNDSEQQAETGALDAGNGLVLINDGKGHFSPVFSRFSGLWASGEVRSMRLMTHAKGQKQLLVGNNNAPVQCFVLQ